VTAGARRILEYVILTYDIRSMLDIPCGDFSWMPLMLARLPDVFHYIGSDIVLELIQRNRHIHPSRDFRVIDLVTDALPVCDLIFCRDALQHLPLDNIMKALDNMSHSGAKYLLTTTHLRQHGWRNRRNSRMGSCRDRNLLLPPFSLPDPIMIFSEQAPGHKFLGLWTLPFQYEYH